MRFLKQCIIILIAALIVCSAVTTAFADTRITVDGYTYVEFASGLGMLVGWDNSSDVLTVPYQIGHVYVSQIGDHAFYNDEYIHTLDLSQASRLEQIGSYAFCSSALTGSLNIPVFVSSLGVSAFENCDGLTEVSINSRGGVVSPQCFQNCDSLTTVVLTDNIKTIERYAFTDCPALSEIYIPSSVTYIDDSAFDNDDNPVIYCTTGSAAQQYAVDHDIEYVLTDVSNTDPTDETTPIIPDGAYLVGDADGDELITIFDVTKIQRVLAQLDDDPDGKISIRAKLDDRLSILDATAIQRYLAFLPTSELIGTTAYY